MLSGMNEIKTRRQAADAGESKYFTGKPCKHGHTGPRYTCSGICCACNSQLAKSYNGRLAKIANNRAAGNFAYPAHPDDHAALLAYAQGLDLARGRIPHAPAAPVQHEAQTPEQIRRFRELALGKVVDLVGTQSRPVVDSSEAWMRDTGGRP